MTGPALEGTAAGAGAALPPAILLTIALRILSLTPAPFSAIRSSVVVEYWPGCALMVLRITSSPKPALAILTITSLVSVAWVKPVTTKRAGSVHRAHLIRIITSAVVEKELASAPQDCRSGMESIPSGSLYWFEVEPQYRKRALAVAAAPGFFLRPRLLYHYNRLMPFSRREGLYPGAFCKGTERYLTRWVSVRSPASRPRGPECRPAAPRAFRCGRRCRKFAAGSGRRPAAIPD